MEADGDESAGLEVHRLLLHRVRHRVRVPLRQQPVERRDSHVGVDSGRLRLYLASQDAAAVSVVAPRSHPHTHAGGRSLRLCNLARHEDLLGGTTLVAEGYGDSGTPPHAGVENIHRGLRQRIEFAMDQSYIDLLSEQGASQAWINIDEFNPLGDEATPDNPIQQDDLSGSKRKLNFSDEEDKALSSAWLSIGMNSIIENQQKEVPIRLEFMKSLKTT